MLIKMFYHASWTGITSMKTPWPHRPFCFFGLSVMQGVARNSI